MPTVDVAARWRDLITELEDWYPPGHPSRRPLYRLRDLVEGTLGEAARLADQAAEATCLADGLLGHLAALCVTADRSGVIIAEDLRHPRELAERIREILGRLEQAHRPDNQEARP